MDGFLKQVAGELWKRYGREVSSLTVVFPNRRARLFFGEALSALIDKPIWQPRYITLDSLAEEISGLAPGDRLRLITELFKVYRGFHPTENFDTFYFWGELLLSDFDTIDKYRAHADTLFANLIDLRELDSRFDYLSEGQKAVIAKFWHSFGQEKDFSPQQKGFLDIWRTLAPVYHSFRARLHELGTAYPGMVCREAADRIETGTAPELARRRYVIVGFNALSPCEQILVDHLDKTYGVDFYWDYDDYYVGDPTQEAGMFIRANIERWPQASSLPGGHDNFRKPKKIISVPTGSNVLQCKYAGGALARIASETGRQPGKETAVVLADEGLLMPLLYSIPAEVDQINVTMGYPLRMHPAYTFVERLLELQNRRRTGRGGTMFYHSDVEGLLGHPYLAGAADNPARFKAQYVYLSAAGLRSTPVLEKIFDTPEDRRALSRYLIEAVAEIARMPFGEEGVSQRNEFFAVITEHIHKLDNSLEDCGLDVSLKTYASLLRRSLQSVSVPFEGEPLAGVQVMGILETRGLDFENVIFLSVNDGNSPGNLSDQPSFIPYNLKAAYGLPTPEHHEGVYAYHFFRLLQRARKIDLVWSSTSDEKNTGEPSRYIYQLDYESPHTVEKGELTVDVNLSPPEPITVEKDPEVCARLEEFLSEPRRKLSPSLFFTYVECPLKFYFRGVARLETDDEVTEEVDNALFGSILHLAMEKLYRPLLGLRDPRERIGAMIGGCEVGDAVTSAVSELYPREEGASPEEWGGNAILVHKTVADYIERNILPFDSSRGPFTIEKLEEWVSADMDFTSADGTVRTVRFHGKVDRLDRLEDGTLRVVDYKTGSPRGADDNERFRDIESLFAGKSDERISAVLQTLLYAMMLRGGGAERVQPALYYVKNLSKEGYSPLFVETGGVRGQRREVEQYGDYSAEFEERLGESMRELFDRSVAFTQSEDPYPCAWCDFRTICQR